MKPIVKKVLEGGLITSHTARLMETWGVLEPDAHELVRDEAEAKTREQLTRFAEELEAELDKTRAVETALDLDQARWPTKVAIMERPTPPSKVGRRVASRVPALMDRAGKYYFRPEDVSTDWLIPGFILFREVVDKSDTSGMGVKNISFESILEARPLSIEDQIAALQVTTEKAQIP